MTTNNTYCKICGTQPYTESVKHPEVCKGCEANVHNCVICKIKITENGQPYSLITTQPQYDKISKLLSNSKDYIFKPASYDKCINQLPSEILEKWDELDIKIFNDKLPGDVRTKASVEMEILETKYFKPLIGFAELWLCSNCESRLERINREFALNQVLNLLNTTDPQTTQMINHLEDYLTGNIDSSDYF